MAKEDTKFEVEGKIIRPEKTQYTIELENGKTIRGYVSGRMKKYNISLTTGDKIICEMDSYNLELCRIVKRI